MVENKQDDCISGDFLADLKCEIELSTEEVGHLGVPDWERESAVCSPSATRGEWAFSAMLPRGVERKR